MSEDRPTGTARGFVRGDRVADYVLDAVVGTGGMGVVWRATAPDGGIVAVKLLHPSLAASDVLVQRFLREVSLGQRLDHPGVVKTLAGGLIEGEADEAVQPWLAMEYVEGRTLRQVVEADGPLPERQVRAIGAAVADALAAVHAAGIVHRDVKPDNLLQDASGRVLLMDLGVARARDEALRLTRSGQFAGSVVYAAPEQFHGGSARIDGTADLYALGATLYELATGSVPWPGMDLLVVYGQKMRGATPVPSATNPQLSADFDGIVLQLMSADPGVRAPDAAAVASWLRGQSGVPGREDVHHTFAMTEDLRDLPRPDDAFVGRLAELHAVDEAWERARLVTLLGAAGSGKTRLALEYGVRHRPRFPGGVCFVDLAEATDAASVLAEVGAALGVPLQAGDATVQVEAVLRGQGGALWILDNAEQVRAPLGDLLERWLLAAPEAAFLVTSRVVLGVPGEAVLPVEALGLPGSDALEAVAGSDAVRLFVARARDLSPRFALDADNAPSVAALVRGLDGLPLAIELAAARVRMLSPAQIADRLGQRWSLLQSRGGDRPDRQATLLDAIRWSWDLLGPTQQSALRQLAAFEGGWTAESAEGVVHLAGTWVVDVLDDLVQSSLVRRIGGDPVRFGMYAAIHQFAGEQLEGSERERAIARHATWFAGFAQAQGTRWLERSDAAALQRLADELPNLRAVARRTTGAPAVHAAWALGLVAERRGPVEAGLTTLSEVAARKDTDGNERIGLLAALARLQGLASLLDDGLATWAEVEILAQTAGDEVQAATALTSKALLHMRAGRLERAREHGQAGLLAFEVLNHTAGRAAAHRTLGVVALHSGALDPGRAHFLAGLDLLDEDDVRGRSAMTNNLGLLELRSGRLAEARAWLEQALALDRRSGDRVGEGKVLTNLGILAIQRGDFDGARQLWEQAVEAHREGGNAEAESKTLNNLSRIHLERGDLDLAWSLARSAVAIKKTLGQPGAESHGRLQLAHIEVARQRWGSARAEAERARALAAESGEHDVLARSTELLQEIAASENQVPQPGSGRKR